MNKNSIFDKKKMTKDYFNVIEDDFSFDHLSIENMKDMSLHTHEFTEIIYLASADASYHVDDKEYKIKERDLIVTPPATPHRITFNPGASYERYRVSISNKLLEGINTEKIYNNIQLINCADQRTISDIFKKCDYYYQSFSREDFIILAKMLIKEIFYNLSVYDGENNVKPSFLSPILSNAIEYINKNLFEIKSVSEICESLFITESYLYEIFKTQLKTSPKKYITSKRLHAAQKELMLGAKPTEIYQKVGFNDYTSFNRSYNKFFGHAPSQEKYYLFSNQHFYL